jgi:GTP pyrophosphokinase
MRLIHFFSIAFLLLGICFLNCGYSYAKNVSEKEVRELEEEAKKRGFSLSDLLTEEAFLRLASKLSFSNQDEMYASVGFGAVSTNQVVLKLIDSYRRLQPKEEIVKYVSNKTTQGSVNVKGMPGLLVRFAGCCNPVPGDDITGFISRGHGVTVHRSDCPNIIHADNDRVIEVNWAERANNSYNAGIKVVGHTQTEVLTIVVGVVAQLKLEIVSTNGRIDAKTGQTVVEFSVRLNSREELDNLINKLQQDKKIIDVYRTAN